MRRHPKPRGFTLVELLVVVTIIVILLSLLAPAMEKAIYQAELATCGAQLKGIAVSVTTYAIAHGRAYPHRHEYDDGSFEFHSLSAGQGDKRPLMRDALGLLDIVRCPLNRSNVVDLDPARASDGEHVLGSYQLYFGARVRNGTGPATMKRIGDRIGYTADERFAVLAGDSETISFDRSPQVSFGSHPSRDGDRVHLAAQDGTTEWNSSNIGGIWGVFTNEQWFGPPQRSPVDLNFAFTDGSVVRYDQVHWFEGQPGNTDAGAQERMGHMPHFSDGRGHPNEFDPLPRR